MEFGFTETQELFRKTLKEFCHRELAAGAKERAKGDHFPKEVLKKMAKIGILGLTIPEEYGGRPSDWVSVGIAVEAVTEPEAGSDAAALQTRAIREGDFYVLKGEKTSITLGMQSDILENVRIPALYRLGEEGQGFYIVMNQFDAIRVCLGLMCVGIAQTSLEEAINYAKNRYAFGKPIAKFEGISFKIAEDYTLLEAARLLCYRALWMKDKGVVHIKESAMCKWFCPQVAVRVIHNAILIHGHYGYSEEMPLEQRLRDVIGWEFADGTAEIMKIIISRELMGREYLPY